MRKTPQANAMMNDVLSGEHQHRADSDSTSPGLKKTKTEPSMNGYRAGATNGPERKATTHLARNVQIVSDMDEMAIGRDPK